MSNSSESEDTIGMTDFEERTCHSYWADVSEESPVAEHFNRIFAPMRSRFAVIAVSLGIISLPSSSAFVIAEAWAVCLAVSLWANCYLARGVVLLADTNPGIRKKTVLYMRTGYRLLFAFGAASLLAPLALVLFSRITG